MSMVCVVMVVLREGNTEVFLDPRTKSARIDDESTGRPGPPVRAGGVQVIADDADVDVAEWDPPGDPGGPGQGCEGPAWPALTR